MSEELGTGPSMEHVVLGKHDLIVVTGTQTRRELRALRKKIREGSPKWRGEVLPLKPGETIRRIPGPLAFELCKNLMQQFFPTLYQLAEMASEQQKAAEKEKRGGPTLEQGTPMEIDPGEAEKEEATDASDTTEGG